MIYPRPLAFFTLLLCGLPAPTPAERPWPSAIAAQAAVIGAKDFRPELPDNLRTEPSQRKTATLLIHDPVAFKILVHYSQLSNHPHAFNRIEVELPDDVPKVDISADFGNAVNLGTKEQVMMAAPIKIQWSGHGWLRSWQRAQIWTLHADGRLEAQK